MILPKNSPTLLASLSSVLFAAVSFGVATGLGASLLTGCQDHAAAPASSTSGQIAGAIHGQAVGPRPEANPAQEDSSAASSDTNFHATASGAKPPAADSSVHRFISVTAEAARRIDLKTDLVKERDLVLPLHLTGHVEPDFGGEVDVSARITGRITKIMLKPGDHVQKGELLAMIDSREVAELEGEMVEAKSKLDIAQAHAERERQVYEEQLARPKALLEERAHVAHARVKLDLANSEFRRVDDLYREKIAAGKDFVSAKATVAEAKVEMEQAQTALQREQHLYDNRVLMKKDYQLALAEVTREKQHLNTIIRRLEFIGADRKLTSEVLATGDINGLARISAPVEGVLNRYEFATGELVHPEQSMFKLTNLKYVQVYADLPEIDLQRVQIGDQVNIKVPSYAKTKFSGKISLIAQHVHLETRSVPIRIKLANFDGKLKPNMYAEIDLEGTPQHCLSFPLAALQEDDTTKEKIVFVKKDGGFEERTVKIGSSSAQYVQVLEGVHSGEEVATQGSLMLKTELSNHQKL